MRCNSWCDRRVVEIDTRVSGEERRGLSRNMNFAAVNARVDDGFLFIAAAGFLGRKEEIGPETFFFLSC